MKIKKWLVLVIVVGLAFGVSGCSDNKLETTLKAEAMLNKCIDIQ